MTGVQTCALPICFPVTIDEGGYGQVGNGGTLYLQGGPSGHGPGYGGTVFIQGGSTGTDYGLVVIQPNTTGPIGVFGSSGSVQINTGGAAATISGSGGTAITTNSLFDGYTIAQVVKALRTYGWLA